MNIQNIHANSFVDSNTENTYGLLQNSINNTSSDEAATELPLEAMVISNITQCTFMGARSPWANS